MKKMEHNLKASYEERNEITYNTEVLKSNLCDYNCVCVLVTGDITVTAASQTQVAFKNSAPFTKFITKINETKIDDAKNLDLVMPNAAAQPAPNAANGILKNEAIAVPVKYLSNLSNNFLVKDYWNECKRI